MYWSLDRLEKGKLLSRDIKAVPEGPLSMCVCAVEKRRSVPDLLQGSIWIFPELVAAAAAAVLPTTLEQPFDIVLVC